MSLECWYCERDTRGPHEPDCSRPSFDGVTYEPQRDRTRLATELVKVQALLERDPSRWWFLRDLAARVGAPEASVSARLRDLRKPKFGGHTVIRRYVGDGLWQYRYTPRRSEGDTCVFVIRVRGIGTLRCELPIGHAGSHTATSPNDGAPPQPSASPADPPRQVA